MVKAYRTSELSHTCTDTRFSGPFPGSHRARCVFSVILVPVREFIYRIVIAQGILDSLNWMIGVPVRGAPVAHYSSLGCSRVLEHRGNCQDPPDPTGSSTSTVRWNKSFSLCSVSNSQQNAFT